MTIKQHGGIFGRNPTFNDVEVDGAIEKSDGSTIIRRTDTDGDVLDIYSDNQKTVSVGTDGLNWYIAGKTTNRVGLFFNNNGVQPMKQGVVTSGELSIGTNVNRWQHVYVTDSVVLSDGGGIDFSATSGTGTSELFDDYEEGTFEPTLEGTTTAGSGTYNANRSGHYTKIGDTVYFTLNVGWNPHTGTGDMIITGLPFTSSSAGSVQRYTFAIASRNMAFSNQLTTVMDQGTATIQLISIADDANQSGVPMDTSTTWVVISGSYKAA